MTGGLEAKIHEGGKRSFNFSLDLSTCSPTLLHVSFPSSHDPGFIFSRRARRTLPPFSPLLHRPLHISHHPSQPNPFQFSLMSVRLTSPRIKPLPRPTPTRLPCTRSPHSLQHPRPRRSYGCRRRRNRCFTPNNPPLVYLFKSYDHHDRA
jgi:hypothetical protein